MLATPTQPKPWLRGFAKERSFPRMNAYNGASYVILTLAIALRSRQSSLLPSAS